MPCLDITQCARSLAPALSRLSLALMLIGTSPVRADGPYTYVPAVQPPPVPPASPALPGAFVTALAGDPQGRVIISTEGDGLWRLEPTSGQYVHFTQQDTNNGLACDDVYALAVDARQRL